jgi:hypothetical protein
MRRKLAWKATVRKKPEPQTVRSEKSPVVEEDGMVELLVVGWIDEG